ncbi:MAG: response regulator [Proteobacteria bacterium]|nr:MAG: response regulator [Pseudomonadota bacterium]
MGRCEKILVVEDNADIREGLSTLLDDYGYSIESAADGREALQKLKASSVPTLVLLDLMMPKMDGWQFLTARKGDPRLAMHKIVTVSAVDRTQWSGASSVPEPDASLSKPIDLEKLWDVVSRFCDEAV